jgi:hypothetical protein
MSFLQHVAGHIEGHTGAVAHICGHAIKQVKQLLLKGACTWMKIDENWK